MDDVVFLIHRKRYLVCERAASEIYIYGLVMVSTGIMKLEKRVARDASNSKIKIKR